MFPHHIVYKKTPLESLQRGQQVQASPWQTMVAPGGLHTDKLGRSHGGLAAASDDPVVREGLSHGGEPLEDALDAAAHLLEGDGRDVLH